MISYYAEVGQWNWG